MFPNLWYFLMGSVFILVTRFFPEGLAGAVNRYGSDAREEDRHRCWRTARRGRQQCPLRPDPRIPTIRTLVRRAQGASDPQRTGSDAQLRMTAKSVWNALWKPVPMTTELKIKDLTVSFDGFKAVDISTLRSNTRNSAS